MQISKYMILVKLLRNKRYQNKPCKNVLRNYSGATTGRVSANALASLSFLSSGNCRIWVTTSSNHVKKMSLPGLFLSHIWSISCPANSLCTIHSCTFHILPELNRYYKQFGVDVLVFVHILKSEKHPQKMLWKIDWIYAWKASWWYFETSFFTSVISSNKFSKVDSITSSVISLSTLFRLHFAPVGFSFFVVVTHRLELQIIFYYQFSRTRDLK